ncbi:ornithine cyclodeaminase family protein [Niveispirillum sp. KHB5.9]|uniref:ornithine cyclodeaminase family protein n=1 Tax=Niveispirillum sp. KHB5.9 TaxID=3400269 RepID=UPI003A8A4BB1
MRAPPAPFRILGREAIRTALPLAACIDLMRDTMMVVSNGGARLPLRTVMPLPGEAGAFALMPGFLEDPAALGAKLLCLMPGNAARGLSSHTGVVLLFNSATGQLQALLDAAEITALRTPAATAAASRVLARPDAGDLALLGTGEQAFAHLAALSLVHPLRSVRLWGRDPEKARSFAARAQVSIAAPITVCGSVEAAVDGADLICTATASAEPILRGRWIGAGTHVNLVGASVQSAAEIDGEGVRQARYFVDYRPSALAQAGELARAVQAGEVGWDHIAAEIGEVHLGRHPGRADGDDITLYKSLGIAAQDLAACTAVLAVAEAENLGLLAEL